MRLPQSVRIDFLGGAHRVTSAAVHPHPPQPRQKGHFHFGIQFIALLSIRTPLPSRHRSSLPRSSCCSHHPQHHHQCPRASCARAPPRSCPRRLRCGSRSHLPQTDLRNWRRAVTRSRTPSKRTPTPTVSHGYARSGCQTHSSHHPSPRPRPRRQNQIQPHRRSPPAPTRHTPAPLRPPGPAPRWGTPLARTRHTPSPPSPPLVPWPP